MIVFPNCKINLGLQVIRKRSDGYHDLETIFYPLPLSDSLGTVLDGSRLGILGFGKLGSRVAGYGQAFGMDVVAWSPSLTEKQATT